MVGLKYRRHPCGDMTRSWEQKYLNLPEPYGETELSLITAKAEIGFNTKLFWTTFLQKKHNFGTST